MTGPAVDLVAVGVARRALAAVVAEHPELTSAPSRARLAEHLPEIIAMPPRLDPDSADSTIVGVRMTPEMRDALDAEVSRQRALNPDVSIGRSNVLRGIVRRALLGSITTPAQTAPAAPAAPIAPVSTDDWSDFSNTRGAPAPSRVVASPAAPVAPPPVAPAAPVVAPITLNDNAAPIAKPAPSHPRTADAAMLASLKARLVAAVAAGQTVKSVAAVAGVNDSGLIQWRKGATGLGPTVAGKLDVALSKLGF